MRESQTWAGHEKTVELKEILEENFLLYDGTGPVPAQINTYLSTNFKDMRGLSKDDPTLKAKAADRWYVPDPNKQSDLDQLRAKRLLKEFAEYKESKQKKLKLFRTEAIRAGFKAAYDQRDYRTIVDVARKLPEQVLQEDEKLLMFYDVAALRLGED
jgi:DNA polymerase I-like protein with 3'-5' exonuclease and polymerase domains